MKTTLSDSSNALFFKSNATIKEVSVKYIGNHPHSLYLYFKNDTLNLNREYYDLGYEVDSCILANKYGTIIFPLSPKRFYQFPNHKDYNKPLEIFSITIAKDSICYELGTEETVQRDRGRIALGSAASYKGDLAKLEMAVQRNDISGLQSPDSVIVFRGIVDVEGTLKNLELLIGEESKRSNRIQKILERNKNCWNPALLWERHMHFESYVRIYIKRSKNGNTVILTSPQQLINISGK